MSDPVLDRITAEPSRYDFEAIPFPAGLAPEWIGTVTKPEDPLPAADVVVMTFTAAEKYALADTLTPGYHYTTWKPYTHEWDAFELHLTDRSPAHEEQALGSYALVTINGKRVLLFGSNLHPATDDVTMPLRALWRQIITETGCQLAIDTGTAGGVGPDVVEGDVLVTSTVQLNYTKLFKDEAFAHERLESTPYTPGPHLALAASTLIPVNAKRLSPIATRLPVVHTEGNDESVDYFAFAAPGDPYGVVKADPEAVMEEMDLGALALACRDLDEHAPCWLSIRCASDPEVKAGTLKEEKAEADEIYEDDGCCAALGSDLCCWAVIADMEV
jgi:nucleoside phosphorylase